MGETHLEREKSLRAAIERLEKENLRLRTERDELARRAQVQQAESKRVVEEIRGAREYAESIVETIHEPLLVLRSDLIVNSANPAFFQLFQIPPKQALGRKIYDLGNGQWNIPSLRQLLEDVLPANNVFNDYEVQHDFEGLGRRVMLLNARRLDHMQLILLGIRDITHRHEIDAATRQSSERLQRMLNIQGVGVLIFNEEGLLIDANATFLRMSGYSREEVAAGRLSWRTMTPPEYVELCERELEKFAELGRIGPYEKECLRKDGSRSWMLFAGAGLGDGTIIEFCIDVSDRKRAEEALRESEERFRALVTASSDVVYRMGPDWRDMRPLLGQDIIADAEDRNWLLKYLPPEEQPQVMAAVDEAIRTRSRFEMVHRVLHADGRVGWRFSRAIPHLDERGEIIEWFGTAKDITDRKKSEEALRASEERLRRAVNIDTVGVLFFSLDGHLHDANDTFERMSGYTRRELAELENWMTLTMPEFVGVTEQTAANLATKGTTPPYEKKMLRKDGSIWWGLFAPTRLSGSGGDAQCVEFIIDITDQKQTEEALRKREVELREAKNAAEEASSAKSEFLANMSHEIRTPMTVFMAAVEHLLQIDRSPERRHLLGMADQAARRLRSLIDDILDFSRIEARKIDLQQEPFALEGCVRGAVEMFTLAAQGKNLRLQTEIAADVPRMIIGDPDRLSQILINLVGNAVKFTHAGEVRVRVQRRGDRLEFAVADTGIGISEEKRELIFQSFSQADASFTRSFGGTGLGLAISKGLVELMGGEISIRSTEGKGSVFTFTLPLPAAEPERSPRAEAAAAGAENTSAIRILLAEDEPMIREMITMMLAQHGWQVEIAETGRKAVEKWEEGGFDLIFMDLQMPDMNGLEATRVIRDREKGEGKPTCIFGLTAHARREIRDDCLQAGMDEVLTKPIQMKDLFAAVQTCISA